MATPESRPLFGYNHGDKVYSVACSSSSSFIVSGCSSFGGNESAVKHSTLVWKWPPPSHSLSLIEKLGDPTRKRQWGQCVESGDTDDIDTESNVVSEIKSEGTCWGVAISEDDRHVVCAQQSGEAVVYNIATAQRVAGFKLDNDPAFPRTFESPVRCCTYSGNNLIAWAHWSSGTLGIARVGDDNNPPEHKFQEMYENSGTINRVRFDGRGTCLLTVDDNGIVCLRRRADDSLDFPRAQIWTRRRSDNNTTAALQSCDLSYDATSILHADHGVVDVHEERAVLLRDVESDKTKCAFQTCKGTLYTSLFATKSSCDDNMVLTASQDGGARLFDARLGVAPVRVFQRNESVLRTAATLSGLDCVVTGGEDGAVAIWETGMGTMVKSSNKV